MNFLLIVLAMLLHTSTSWVFTVVLLVGCAAMFVGNIIFRQESMLYVPCVAAGMQTPADNPKGMRSPSEKGLEFEDVYLKTTDGLKIHCWFIPCRKSETAPTVLFCHANAGNIGMRVPNFAQLVEKLEANILALDYRGFGHSEGTPSEEGLIEDALTAWRWLRTASDAGRIDGRRIFVFGRSLGGAVAIALASALQRQTEGKPCGLILENTFLSISRVVDAAFPLIAFNKSFKARFLRLKWESIERIREVEVPLLFLTGGVDEVIPPLHSEKLREGAVKCPLKRGVVFPEGGHNDLLEKGGSHYWEVQASFIKVCMAEIAQ